MTVKEQQDWKIPPCISNWKNNRGFTIALDKRLVADGRGLQDHTISDNFAKLAQSLYMADREVGKPFFSISFPVLFTPLHFQRLEKQ